MRPKRTWILLADAAHAKVLEYCGPGRCLQQVDGAVFTHGHAPSRDLKSSRPGRAYSSTGATRHAFTSHTDPHTFEKYKFSRELMRFLNVHAQQNSYDRLIMVAPPKMLGDFRRILPKETHIKLYKEVAKDLVSIPIHELPAHLQDIIAI